MTPYDLICQLKRSINYIKYSTCCLLLYYNNNFIFLQTEVIHKGTKAKVKRNESEPRSQKSNCRCYKQISNWIQIQMARIWNESLELLDLVNESHKYGFKIQEHVIRSIIQIRLKHVSFYLVVNIIRIISCN